MKVITKTPFAKKEKRGRKPAQSLLVKREPDQSLKAWRSESPFPKTTNIVTIPKSAITARTCQLCLARVCPTQDKRRFSPDLKRQAAILFA
jgi:hypothetical protein